MVRASKETMKIRCIQAVDLHSMTDEEKIELLFAMEFVETLLLLLLLPPLRRCEKSTSNDSIRFFFVPLTSRNEKRNEKENIF